MIETNRETKTRAFSEPHTHGLEAWTITQTNEKTLRLL